LQNEAGKFREGRTGCNFRSQVTSDQEEETIFEVLFDSFEAAHRIY
jgi:hypothetical protein